MKTVFIIDTGGTFNKTYDPISGELVIDTEGKALQVLAKRWRTSFEAIHIIGKDSLEMNSQDRLEIMLHINQTPHEKILIVHGTDTIHVTAEYLAESELEKQIILTGAMVPFSIDPIEASANFASAYGFLQGTDKKGVYVALNGLILPYDKIKKDKKLGKFIKIS